MRRLLNVLYDGAAVLACLFLISIAVLTLVTIASRLMGVALYSMDEFGGWAMAASTFLGLAATMRRNEHIRVTLLIERLPPFARKFTEIVCLVVATLFMGIFAWYAVHMVIQSHEFGEMTQGMVPVPLWMPQTGMALGVVLMFIALADDLLRALRGKPTSYESAAPASMTEAV